MDANTAADNASLMRLAERLVQQQEAALTAPTGIRAAIPQQGRLLTFRRAVQVDTFTDLRIRVEAQASKLASSGFRLTLLLTAFAGFVGLAWWTGRVVKQILLTGGN
ncbi:MAG: hypothetical protein EXS36_07865 [Pedosphaera sp.]|nr:hypothetical protein [Pedosphaera sp.]